MVGSEPHEVGPGSEPVEPLTTLHVQRARTGDRESLAWLVVRFGPLLLAQARYRLGPRLSHRVDPEDVVQDVWATALPRLSGLSLRDGRATPVLLRFLGTTLVHHVNNLLRRAATAGRDPADATADPEALAAVTPGPVTRVAESEGARLVLAAIDALPPRDREILILRGIEQMDNGEVAQELGLSANAAAQAFHRALERLRAQLPGSVFGELE